MQKLTSTSVAAVIATLFLLIFPAAYFSQSDDESERTVNSSIVIRRSPDGQTLVTTINRRFSVIDFPTAPLPAPLLLLEEVKKEHQLGVEGDHSMIKADAWFGINNQTKAWTIEQDGDEGKVFDEFYLVTKFGCCAAAPVNFYFNLETGQKVFTATNKLSTIVVPNTSYYRYIAYHSISGVVAPVEIKQKDVVGLLQYATSKNTLFKVVIHSPLPELLEHIKFQYQNKISDDSVMLWGANGKDTKESLSNFAIIVSYGTRGDIILPVTSDAIDLSKARIPLGFRLEVIK